MYRLLLFSLLTAALPHCAFTQASDREIDLEGADAVHIEAAYSSISLTTGGAEAVRVNHILTAAGADRPDLRELEVKREGRTIVIRELKPTVRSLSAEFPQRGDVMRSGNHRDGKGTFNGVLIKAVLEVVVPEGVAVTVETEYGGITATNVTGLREARAKYGSVDIILTGGTQPAAMDLYSNYGAVDVTLPGNQSLDLDLTTEYGELLTNMDIAIDEEASNEKEFYQRVVGTLGAGGVKLRCKAPYGNVYLRAAK